MQVTKKVCSKLRIPSYNDSDEAPSQAAGGKFRQQAVMAPVLLGLDFQQSADVTLT